MFKITICLSSHDSSYAFNESFNRLNNKYPNQFCIKFIDINKMDESIANYESYKVELEGADYCFILIHGGITFFNSFDRLMEDFQEKKKFFIHSGIDDENKFLFEKSNISNIIYQEILKYYLMSGADNYENMFLYLANKIGDYNFEYKEPIPPKWEGIYDINKEVLDEQKYINNLKKIGKPIVGILIFSSYYHEKNLEHVDAIINKVIELGGSPLTIYTSSVPNLAIGCKGFQWVLNNLLMNGKIPNVDVIINTMGYAQSILSNPGDGTVVVENSIFEKLGVPVIQAMTTYYNLEEYKKSLCGIDMMSLSTSVYYPEFDGQIISVPIGYLDFVEDTFGKKMIFRPITNRVDKVCNMAMNWAKLRKISSSEKKVAILFHNMPPRNDMIGCAFGLDSPASVFNMVESLKKEGIKTDYCFKNGNEIIEKITEAVSNDISWLSADQVINRSVDIIRKEDYIKWFENLPESVKEKMEIDWGKAPGEFMVYEENMPVPGIINGNIFIGLQPARGYEEKADEVYHSTDIVPPHQYIAYYKWIKHVFKADVIIHVGTHGTLEWLPGKEIGLSNECYPDIAIDDLPHLYPYSINVEGEGIQAKRRSYAVILDHLIPALIQSGTYDEMEEIDELIKQYIQAKQGDRGKLPILQEQIKEIMLKNNFDNDLNVSKNEINNNFDDIMSRLHEWIEDIKNNLIKDGLHIYGEVPKNDRLTSLVHALVRIQNYDSPSILEATTSIKGYDFNHLKEFPNEVDNIGRTNLMILDEVEFESRELIQGLHESKYQIEKIDSIITDKYPEAKINKVATLKQVLTFVCNVVIPKLNNTTDEIKYLVEGVNGRFVPPGGSGSPTRGRVDILPTGRNFYSVDPSAIPTRASWQVGKQLGYKLIQRYISDEGKYPDSIVIVIYAGETMKTNGDDIAEILYLLGIKPKWLKGTDKVIGLEAISLEELKRPRIDVTLRITGLFRDTFPNVIELVEDAVSLAASQDEDENDNYIKKNITSELNKLVKAGVMLEEAEEQSKMRIFGCPPGTYGAGVDILINSKNWEDNSDLGNVFTLWGGNAYGKKVHGKKVIDVFARRLASADATVKNESSMEIDMLESDDYYNYHGGLIAAVKTHSGKTPKAYCGDSSDPSRTTIKDVNEQTAKIMRSRILNPKWFDGLKEHGYRGAQEISAMVDIIFGWDATSDVVEDWMYSKITENYLFNEERRKWIEDVNKWAVHNMSERLLEASQRGMWNADEEEIEKLTNIYLESEGNIEDLC